MAEIGEWIREDQGEEKAACGLAGVTGREVRKGRSMGSIGDGNPEAGKAVGDVVVQSWG